MAERRLYLDEDVSAAVAAGLANRHDVVHVTASDYRGKSDAWHFRRAAEDARIIVTGNHHDFRFLHRIWVSLQFFAVVTDRHPGILSATHAPRRAQAWLDALLSRLDMPEDLSGKLLVWNAASSEWREDAWRPDD